MLENTISGNPRHTFFKTPLLLTRPRDVLPTSCVRTLQRTEHDVFGDESFHVPDGLTRSTRQLRYAPELVVCHLGDAQLLKGNGEVDGEQELEEDVEFG